MRRARAIAFTTAREILSEPLVLLVAVLAIALSALAPAVHYHQFGDPSRMSRDAGLSMVLVGGTVIAVFGAIMTVRREIESGTALVALSHPVSRGVFFLSKVFGTAVACLAVETAIVCSSLTMVNGALIGEAVGVRFGRLAPIWGPSLALAISAAVLPLFAAAVLNRLLRFRFTPTANLLALAIAVVGACYRFDSELFARFVPVCLLTSLPTLLALAAAATFASRFRTPIAATLTAVAVGLFLPALGNYCLGDALANGGRVQTGYLLLAVLALVPPVALLLFVGARLFGGKDIA